MQQYIRTKVLSKIQRQNRHFICSKSGLLREGSLIEIGARSQLTIREQYPKIIWKDIAGMQDKIAHVYFGVSLETVWRTAHEDLPELRPVIQSILDEIQASEEPI